MSVLTIELADRIEDACSCCGGRLVRLTRFVRADGDAHAVYYADFSPDHLERAVRVALSLGAWGGWDGGRVPKQRVAFALRIRATAGEYQTAVLNAAESPWQNVKALGKMLVREDALAHPWLQEVFRITDGIVTEDRDVSEYLEGPGGGPAPGRQTSRSHPAKRKRK